MSRNLTVHFSVSIDKQILFY